MRIVLEFVRRLFDAVVLCIAKHIRKTQRCPSYKEEVAKSRYELFERSQIDLRNLAERGRDMTVERLLPLEPPLSPFEHAELDDLVEAIVAARQADRPVIMMGGLVNAIPVNCAANDPVLHPGCERRLQSAGLGSRATNRSGLT